MWVFFSLLYLIGLILGCVYIIKGVLKRNREEKEDRAVQKSILEEMEKANRLSRETNDLMKADVAKKVQNQ